MTNSTNSASITKLSKFKWLLVQPPQAAQSGQSSGSSVEWPRYHEVKRVVLCFICLVDILIYVVYASKANYFAAKWLGQHNQTESNTDAEEYLLKHNHAIRMIVAGSLIGILFQLCGLLGAILRSLAFMVAYAVPMSLGAIYALVRVTHNFRIYWINTIWSLMIATFTLLYLWDLWRIRRLTQQHFKTAPQDIDVDIDCDNGNGPHQHHHQQMKSKQIAVVQPSKQESSATNIEEQQSFLDKEIKSFVIDGYK